MRSVETDYVVIGAGSAGCVLANRLSADPVNHVVVLEAGGVDRNIWIHIPIGYGKTFFDKEINWMFKTEPEPALDGRAIDQPRGRVLGGSSSINGLLYVRGQAQDYDGWAALGNFGWGFPDVLPFFKRAEDQQRGADAWHGVGGPLSVSDLPEPHPIADAFIASAEANGVPRNPDFNGSRQEGVGYFQATARRGLRRSTARAYLHPVMTRSNLQVQTGAQVGRILLEGAGDALRAVGVAYVKDGREQRVMARREVILSGGAIQSPQILQLSGVGPAALLRQHRIAVVRDLPGVGANLQDHMQGRLIYQTHAPITLNDDMMGIAGRIRIGLRYMLQRKGPLGWWAGVAGGFARTRPDLDRPDIQFHLYPFSTDRKDKPALHRFSAFTLTVCQLRPYSRGSVHIQSANPLQAPAIRMNYLSDPRDIEVLTSGLVLARQIASTAPLAGLIKTERSPGIEVTSRAGLHKFLREKGMSVYHPVGTCRMGASADCVVDERLRVHGISGLRVSDASIMPTLISGNTNAPAIMIGEKAADMILTDQSGKAA
ncbi:choline dehydrogenase [Verminephrobacter eiseniae]|uniref:GMC family oxidoreductase n=1 Tax=Verminephrobacter eiseniae TaxID=364317 RepID=UPI002237F68C|nr:choline dehydrogenase [Verminephrobacter eiseniae]MCW5260448.1 choline dehydrogenase [Verminephrobacter eiseniae]